MLEEEIREEIKALSSLEFGSREHSTAVNNLTTLYKLRVEEESCGQELEANRLYKEQERLFKREQLKEQIKDRYFKLGMEAAGLILPLMFYALWMKKGFKFEETGTFTSTTFRGLFSRFNPSRR